MIEIVDKNDGVRKLYRCREDYVPLGTQEAEPATENGVFKLTLEITDRRGNKILSRTYEDNIPLQTSEPTEPATEPAEPTGETTETTEPAETQETTEPTTEPSEPEN